ncbi:hypothetical protein [Anaeromyxobacter dehalogenans]|uniref:V-type ATP synthase subunit E n=1 Tax=Anaeromyxobacter dehalogenans (strain 2CP-C) TaxID=290397 RepID=Q2IQ88_ANADE|nr:hypothetical protein [Anaeromyxobacter dehalogenans]ABC80973.1 conserved hypothetical protein [Anaeromyxobacter dehalogenans 2CP-C]
MTVGYGDLLRVLAEEAEREGRELRAAAEREAARVLEEARAATAAARDALLARAAADAAEAARAGGDALGRERERVSLLARREALEALHRAAAGGLAAEGDAALDARLLAELLPEVGEAPFEVEVDPGAGEACRAALARLDPAAAARATVREAAAPRGGVRVRVGRRELDDTLPARLERLWPEAEAELAAILFAEAGAWPGSTA